MKPSSFDAEFFTDSDELDEPDMIFFNFWVGPGNYQKSWIRNFIIFGENKKQFFARFCMHLRLKILTEIAISPILIGANGAPLQGGVKKKFP